MIIGFTGRLQTGKTTAANVLVDQFGFQKLSFADPIRQMMADVDPIVHPDGLMSYNDAVDMFGYDQAKKDFPEIRRLMQSIGVSARERIGPDVWVDALVRSLPGADGVFNTNPNVVIDDVRFQNEAEMIRDFGGRLFRIERPGLPQSDHVSETEGDSIYVDRIFHNAEDLETFQDLVRTHFEGNL